MDLKAVANDTLRILEAGFYEVGGARIDIAADVDRSCKSAFSVSPEELSERRRARDSDHETSHSTRTSLCTVTGESTLEAARRLLSEGARSVACLNFASARSVGGGFLNGARAQEEALCRASALYPTLLGQRRYYDANRCSADVTYTDWAIVSPDVPVFRDDQHRLVEPARCHFITAPAPNPGADPSLRKERRRLREIFERRIHNILILSEAVGATHVVLGAWGCGAFRNDPQLVAEVFRDVLATGWSRRFAVVFAILDHKRGESNRSVFDEVLR